MKELRLFGFICLLFTVVIGCDGKNSPGCQGPSAPFLKHSSRSHAPDFTLSVWNNPQSKVTLSDVVKDQSVLLVFWATWCPSCTAEIPILNDWHVKYGGKGLEILAVNVQEPKRQIRDFVKNNPIRYPSLLDADGEVAAQYGLVALPSSVFLAKGGEIIYYGFGLPDNIEHLLTRA